MSRYIFGGADEALGRFSTVKTGDVLELTDAEAAAVVGNANFAAFPTRSKLEKKVSSSGNLTTADSGKQIRCNHTADITLTLADTPTLGDNFEIIFGDGADPTKKVTIDPGAVNTISGVQDLASVVMAAPGTGYNVSDTITIAGGTSSQAAVLTVATIKAVAAALVAAGTGYTAGDVLTVSGGTSTSSVQITADTVDGDGLILTSHISRVGSYTVKPANHVAVTGGTGTGATFDLNWGVLTAIVSTAGSYTVEPSNPVAQDSTSGTGTGATFTATWEDEVTVLEAADDSLGLYWDGAKWSIF